MARVQTEAVIYRQIKYSDSSAIVHAFTKEYGVIKLFVQKAYSKKRGLLSFVPGTLDMMKKEQSDLNRFYGFQQEPSKLFYLDNHEILMRLYVVFELMENILGSGETDDKLWTLLNKYDDENFRKLSLYILHHILKRNGFMTDFSHCESCGKESPTAFLSEEGFYCGDCVEETGQGIELGPVVLNFLRHIENSKLFRQTVITRANELEILNFFKKYISFAAGVELKSFQTLYKFI